MVGLIFFCIFENDKAPFNGCKLLTKNIKVMKKFLLTLAVCLCAAFSAQAQNWAVGGRVSAGLQAQASYHFSNENYVEGRLGMTALAGLSADFTALYMWNVANMDWTPSAGQWFVDLGCGAAVGGHAANAMFFGAVGSAKLGIKFDNAPIRLALDWSPVMGVYAGEFFPAGFGNLGISAVYCF